MQSVSPTPAFLPMNQSLPAAEVANTAPLGKTRFVNLDVLRGIASLGVVFYHCRTVVPLFAEQGIILASVGAFFSWLMSFGYHGVTLFFVISGFCIHLRWAKAYAAGKDTHLDFLSFWNRRIHRLYPAYLAALTLFILVEFWEGQLALSWFLIYDIASHLLMLHNLDSRTVFSFNGVLWTLAIEEQLYLAYFLLLWLRKRWGWWSTLAICLAARVAWFVASLAMLKFWGIKTPANYSAAMHWMTWALGAVCVELSVGALKWPRLKNRAGLAIIFLILAVAIEQVGLKSTGLMSISLNLFAAPLVGLAFAWLVFSLITTEKNRLAKLDTWLIQAFAAIGLFSYSLYLTHQLLLNHLPLQWLGLLETTGALLLMTPATVLFAWFFFNIAEKPFIAPPSIIPVFRSPQSLSA